LSDLTQIGLNSAKSLFSLPLHPNNTMYLLVFPEWQ